MEKCTAGTPDSPNLPDTFSNQRKSVFLQLSLVGHITGHFSPGRQFSLWGSFSLVCACLPIWEGNTTVWGANSRGGNLPLPQNG